MTAASSRYARVVMNTPLERAFDYAVPASLREIVRVGTRVRAPFGPRVMTGVVVELPARAQVRRVRALYAAVDEQPVYTAELLKLGHWLAERYYCSLGEALAVMAPPVTGRQGVILPVSSVAAAAWAWPEPSRRSDWRSSSAAVTVVELAPDVLPWDWLAQALPSAGERAALVLVPEQRQVDFLARLWGAPLGEAAVFLHHASGPKYRRDVWGRALAGQLRLVVGTRLAAFTPLPHCGLVVVMDEHDTSYKQDSVPHYHAREVALERARQWGCPALLASASPSMEAWQLAQQRAATWVTVRDGTVKPRIYVVDVHMHQGSKRRGWPLITPPLERALDQTLQQDGRALVWLNRLGFATRVQCQKCGHVMACERCAAPLTFFSRERVLRCRYCAAEQPAVDACPHCRENTLRYRGRGVEKAASEVARKFPTATLQVYDRRGRGARTEAVEASGEPSAQIIVGTEVLLHGWPLPRVQLVGALAIDAVLAIPDFRATERLLQRLVRALQCLVPGKDGAPVFVAQAINPDLPVLAQFTRHEMHAFYRHELGMRRRHRLPPVTHHVQVVVRGRDAASTEARAGALAEALRTQHAHITVLGPAPLMPFKRQGRYQWHVILQGARVPALIKALRRVLEDGRRWQGAPVTVDVDPL